MKNKICVKQKKLSTYPIIKELFDKTNTICVTGKMASGKNFVCSELEKMGWTSVDADLGVAILDYHEACSPVALGEYLPIIDEVSDDFLSVIYELVVRAPGNHIDA